MRSKISHIFLKCLIMLTLSQIVLAEPMGYWLTRDQSTGKPRGLVHLYVVKGSGELHGKLKKVFPMPGDTGFCRKCPGKFKDKPTKDLPIVWGLKKQRDGYWDKGEILDPKSGKIYNCSMIEASDGKTLKVRGYIGFSLIGRNQSWERLSSGEYQKQLRKKS